MNDVIFQLLFIKIVSSIIVGTLIVSFPLDNILKQLKYVYLPTVDTKKGKPYIKGDIKKG